MGEDGIFIVLDDMYIGGYVDFVEFIFKISEDNVGIYSEFFEGEVSVELGLFIFGFNDYSVVKKLEFDFV